MATPKATVLCILLYLSLQSHSLGQVYPNVTFMGISLANHSYVNLSLVGNAADGSDSVKCHTDLDTCCSRSQGPGRGDWYFPTGGRLKFSDGDGDIYEVRVAQSVDLRRRNNETISGIYRCNISTNHNNATVYTGLYASGGDVTIANSDNLNFTENSDLNGDSPKFTLTCISTGGPATTVTWTRDSKIVMGEETTVLDDPVTAQYTHTLIVTARLGGHYQCSVSNDKPSTANSSFTVKEASAPGNLTAVQRSPTSIYVSWSPPTTLGHTTGYNIYYKTGEILSNITIETPKTNHLLSNLMNGASYNISIVATSEHLYSDYVNTPNLIPLVPGKPTLRIESRNATTISLSWSVPNGSVVLSYTVMWERDSSSISECSTTENANNTTVNDVYSYMITGLEEDRTYVVMLIATNDAGSTPSENVTGSTEEAAPSAPPGSVTLSNETSYSIVIQWSAVECIHRNGDITGYSVRYGSNDITSILNVSKGDSTKITLSELEPSSNYSIEVAAINSAGIGPYSSPEHAQTLDDPPVVSVESYTSTTISVSVSWMSTSRDPDGFVVVWRRDTMAGYCPDEDIGNFTVSDGSAKYIISGLEEASHYSIIVRRAKLVSEAVVGMTGETAPSAPPGNITQTGTTPSSVTIQWEAVECIDRNGNITGYDVQLERENEDVMNMSIRGTATESTVSMLESSTTYDIRVAAVNSAGRGVFSSKLNVSTSEPETPEKEDPTGKGGGAGGGGSNAGGAVAGVIVSLLVVAGIVALGVVGVWLWRRKQKSKGYFPTSHYNISRRQDSVSYSKQTDLMSLDGKPSVSLAPEIEEVSELGSVVEGEAVLFCAEETGTSQSKSTWYHDGESVDYSTKQADDGSLTIRSTEKKQSGVYKLEAENEEGKVEKDKQLRVSVGSPEHELLSSQEPAKFSPVPVAMFGSHVEKHHGYNNQPFVNEFESIGEGEGKSIVISRSPQNRKKNRFANISVYDDNRVILSKMEDHESEYINASYVDGYSVPKKFIASQGPIPITLVDFWRMVWQEKAPSIVMITNLLEGTRAKCEQYWPQTGSLGFGPFQVTITDQQILADYTVRRLNVQRTGSSERAMTVTQFHYTAWPDHGVPDYATPILTFHKRIMREHKPSKGPIIIHCSAGVGRTGTFITIDHILEQVEKEGVINISGVIYKLRQQRINMVQTPAQYIFIHDAILESVMCGDTQINAGLLRKKLKSLQEKDQSGQTQLDLQFSTLNQVSTNPEDAKMFAAHNNPTKNRSTEFLPVDQWRVVLKGENPDYINATNIHGYKQQRAFIITQGPMQSTRRDFWKMVCDRKCSVIVMLSDLVEQDEEVCHQYWPRSSFQAFGELTVELMSEEKFEGYVIRTLCLQRAKFGKMHQVYQFQITNWAADGKCSNLKTVTTVIDKMTKIQRRTGNHSITVHCSDTVSRSAVFCGIVTTIERCKTEGVVDVFQVVKAMRVQKPGAVRTVEQYLTIFEALLVFLDSFETYANFLQ